MHCVPVGTQHPVTLALPSVLSGVGEAISSTGLESFTDQHIHLDRAAAPMSQSWREVENGKYVLALAASEKLWVM